jgi:hypothetical protein
MKLALIASSCRKSRGKDATPWFDVSVSNALPSTPTKSNITATTSSPGPVTRSQAAAATPPPKSPVTRSQAAAQAATPPPKPPAKGKKKMTPIKRKKLSEL